MSAETLERSVLEGKDRDQLIAIASALGLKSLSRAKKAEIIDRILEHTGAGPSVIAVAETSANGNGNGQPTRPEAVAEATAVPDEPTAPSSDQAVDGAPASAAATPGVILVDEYGEPLADWEIELRLAEAAAAVSAGGDSGGDGAQPEAKAPEAAPAVEAGEEASDDDTPSDRTYAEAEGERTGRRRRRRRRKGGGLDDGPQGADRGDRNDRDRESRGAEEAVSSEPIQVAGYLDLRDEGYGFLRVNGYLSSRDDVYVSVKQTRQYGLRKGDHVTGLSRVAGRNEKNPALLQILTVNGGDPEQARLRPKFEDLTPLFPDEKLQLESSGDPSNMTARIIDLIAPIGKGQRGLIVSPPKAGKTFIMKTIATSIERNNPEVKLLVLLIDERPEEVTDMRRTVQGEVIASTFDRPSDEHTHLAELAIEKAKRMVEAGDDVVVILDGITRLSRAYNLAAPATGRIMSGGIDAGALYPPKKFFGAARNIEEGGSLTILATALVETNSRMDDAIFEEFKGTGNMELRLDRKLAERRIFPAIDVDASSTRHEELLFDRKQLQQVWKLRRVLSGLAADGNAAPGLELLMDRLKTFRSNDEFLAEIAKSPSM
jgi:transcription termination factor Rho